ncbi:MAG: ribonuclease HII [Anaerolineae bacterium]
MTWPDLAREQELWQAGYHWGAGRDEVGRGALAGPVVAAAVILPSVRADLCVVLCGVRDSKMLTQHKREALFPLICSVSLGIGIGIASARFIDRWGIAQAVRQAMLMAVHNLPIAPDYLLIDAVRLLDAGIAQESLIKGDSRVLSIAAASVVAKVFRDRLMVALDRYQPGYGFARHKGYGTAAHRAALERLGPCPAHRRSFAPLNKLGGTSDSL